MKNTGAHSVNFAWEPTALAYLTASALPEGLHHLEFDLVALPAVGDQVQLTLPQRGGAPFLITTYVLRVEHSASPLLMGRDACHHVTIVITPIRQS